MRPPYTILHNNTFKKNYKKKKREVAFGLVCIKVSYGHKFCLWFVEVHVKNIQIFIVDLDDGVLGFQGL